MTTFAVWEAEFEPIHLRGEMEYEAMCGANRTGSPQSLLLTNCVGLVTCTACKQIKGRETGENGGGG